MCVCVCVWGGLCGRVYVCDVCGGVVCVCVGGLCGRVCVCDVCGGRLCVCSLAHNYSMLIIQTLFWALQISYSS